MTDLRTSQYRAGCQRRPGGQGPAEIRADGLGWRLKSRNSPANMAQGQLNGYGNCWKARTKRWRVGRQKVFLIVDSGVLRNPWSSIEAARCE